MCKLIQKFVIQNLLSLTLLLLSLFESLDQQIDLLGTAVNEFCKKNKNNTKPRANKMTEIPNFDHQEVYCEVHLLPT